MKKFPTQFDKHVRHHAQVGSRKKTMFEPSFDDDGNFGLVATGEADIYEEIQSHKDSVDINVLLKKFKEGDTSVLERAQSFYGDVTGVPTSYSGMLNSMLKSRDIFNGLPVEIRARFDHSFEKFISAMDDPSFFTLLSGTSKQDSVSDQTESEVSE